MPEIIVKKPKKETTTDSQTEENGVGIEGASAKLKAAMNELEGIFVNRTEEINMITLALACGQHVLLEGKHGVAKSDLAREAFKRITGCQVYDKMFAKGVVNDDVFGPTDMQKYREEAIYEHNTQGALPTAHFANLEELGRASDMLLPSLMTVLNERLFHNGKRVEKCPLISAIATANFITETDELAAFNDRWLIRTIVKPLDSNQKIIDMLERSIRERPVIKDTVSLKEIQAINDAVRKIKISEETIPLYVDLVSQYKREEKLDISDRRINAAFRLARAQAVLDGSEEVTADHLFVVRYGISVCGKHDETKFSTVYQRVVGDAAKLKEENKNISAIEKFVQKWRAEYDPSKPEKVLREILAQADKAYEGIKAKTKPCINLQNQDRLNKAAQIAADLRQEIRQVLSQK